MAKQLITQANFQAARRHTFCYLCTRSFKPDERRDRDHVPPKALFGSADRQPALVLPSHVACNAARSPDDEVITQLMGVLHGRPIAPHGRKPKFAAGTFPDGSLGVGVGGLQLKEIIFRWVCGFHAALYGEPLGPAIRMVFPPFPEGRVQEEHQVEAVPVPDGVPLLVKELKRNRLTGTLDVMVCRNGRCRYECVWSQADDGRPICIWALDLYGWQDLGDIKHFERRGCVGLYGPNSRLIPSLASRGTRLEFSVPTGERLDPFGGSTSLK